MWFIAFLALVFIAYLINDSLANFINYNISASFIHALFMLNIFGLSTIVFMIQFYFVGRQKELKDAIEDKSLVLEAQTEKLKEMDKVKSRFFANISHEFRTPLTLILGLAQKQLSTNKTSAKDADALKRNAQQLLLLINQLLDLSKLESGELHLDIVKKDIAAFTKNIVYMYQSLADVKQITIDITQNILGTEASLLLFDEDKLQKIIANILSNAIKFTPEKGFIQIELNNKSEFIEIKISNTGEGIAPEILPYVFDRFYQAETETTRRYEGTGVGLALVKELIELHKGKVEVKSNSNKTTFSIFLPTNETYGLDQVDIVTLPTYKSSDNIIVPSTQTADEKISENESNEKWDFLIVEDNHDLRAFIRSILEPTYNVIEAVDGKDGLKKAVEHIPDLIISDVMMPKMSGYELCKEVKSNSKTNHIPIILLTAKASQENKIEGLETGADAYLIKPFDQEELLIRINNLCSQREQLQKKYQQEVWLRPKDVSITSVHQSFLENLKNAIERNLDNDKFSVDDLGNELAMSRSQVHRKLKALMDQSATKFIRDYRLHRAADLIKNDSGNITEIAYSVGFNSQTYFSKCFQEVFNCSPSEYKENSIPQ
jgi:signal transduction histidine kinase/DNA-binding response OmpR family regulator